MLVAAIRSTGKGMMYLRNRSTYGKPIKTIHAGEYFVSASDELIGTLLGSCVAVCLHDSEERVSGMNHFMLPGRIVKDDLFRDSSARYGISAINELIEDLLKRGARKRNLIAKVFGGGSVLNLKSSVTVPIDNVRLAKVMLEIEDIPILEEDTGGTYTRKVLMDVLTGRVFLKKTTGKVMRERVYSDELNYARRLQE